LATGNWTSSSYLEGYQNIGYRHDANSGKGAKKFRWTPNLPAGGLYHVFLRWTSGSNRADNIPVNLQTSSGLIPLAINQKQNGGTWIALGSYRFPGGTGSYLELTTGGTNGFVIADAAMWVPAVDSDLDSLADSWEHT
jgi:hypothetical protein